jgi:nucleotide-binding universal stress UspA family protein
MNEPTEQGATRNGLQNLFKRIVTPFHRKRQSEAILSEETADADAGSGARQEAKAPLFRRILVGVDASAQSMAALEVGAEIAAGLKSELHGVFIEDIELHKLAALPVAREVRYPCGTGSILTPEAMRRELRAQATLAQRALSRLCQEMSLPGSFRTVRGDVQQTIVRVANEMDLLVLGRFSRPLVQRPRLGSTARAAAVNAKTSVLLVHPTHVIHPPIVLAYDGTQPSRKALRIALHLARRIKSHLTVLALTHDEQTTVDQLRQQTSRVVHGQVPIRFRPMAHAGPATIVHEIEAEAAGMLLMSETILPLLHVDDLLESAGCTLMLVRGE